MNTMNTNTIYNRTVWYGKVSTSYGTLQYRYSSFFKRLDILSVFCQYTYVYTFVRNFSGIKIHSTLRTSVPPYIKSIQINPVINPINTPYYHKSTLPVQLYSKNRHTISLASPFDFFQKIL